MPGREQQSPIDIVDDVVFKTSDLRAKISWTRLELAYLKAHKFEVTGSNGVLVLDGADYTPIDVHWHFGSEHASNGKRYRGEVHIVHVLASQKKMVANGQLDWLELAVLGVYLASGKKSYAAIDAEARIVAEAKEDQKPKGRVTLDRADLLPSNASAVRYAGSLTTPPYSENVQWVVFDKPMLATTKQTPSGAPNQRPLQARNRRYLVRGKVGRAV